jgi:hypothetical protein
MPDGKKVRIVLELEVPETVLDFVSSLTDNSNALYELELLKSLKARLDYSYPIGDPLREKLELELDELIEKKEQTATTYYPYLLG